MSEAVIMASMIGNLTALVNGNLTARGRDLVRSYYRMDLKGILERIEARLDAVEMTANAASNAAKRPDAIRNLKRAVEEGKRKGISTDTLIALAPVLKTTASWLLTGQGESPGAGVPLVGFVGAGAEAVMFAEGQAPDEFVDAPDGVTDRTVAVEIRGTSLGELFDRWIVYYDDVRSPITSDLIGRLCVVGLADGRIVVKKPKRGHNAGRFDLYSNTEPPIYDAEIAWAARVKQMRPR